MHLLFLAARVGFLFLSLLGLCVWLNRSFRIQAAQTPLVAACGIGMVLYFAALLNVLGPAQLALCLAGPILALLTVKKDGPKASVRPFVTVGIALFGAAALWLLLLERGRLIESHDALAHWAIMAKSILTNGQLPNTANLAIEYVDYPPATALWIVFVCKVIGFSDGSMVFAQGLLSLAAVLSFAPLCRKKWYGGVLAVSYGLYVFGVSIGIRDLRVDGLLTLLAAGAIAVVLAHREEPKLALATALPVLSFLAITKNSGLFFVLAGALTLFAVAAPAVKKLWLVVAGVGIPAVCWWLWGCHVRLVYPNGMESKHAVSAEAYESRFAGKTAEELQQFEDKFFHHYLELDHPKILSYWLIVAVFLLVCLWLWRAGGFSGKAAIGWAGGALAMTVGYLGALWGTYVFSMPTDEMLVLASIDRYSSSFFDLLLAGAVLLILAFGSKAKAKTKAVLCTLLAAVQLVAVSALGSWSFAYGRASVWAASARQQIWLEQKALYPIRDGARYLIYTNGSPMDGWSDRFVGRYALNTDVLDFWQYREEAPNLDTLCNNYDYVLFLGPDEYSRKLLSDWNFDPETPYIETQLFSARQDEFVQNGIPLPEGARTQNGN